MAKYRVWNDNTINWVEDFRGDKIAIPAGKFVVMDESDAVLFRGQAVAIQRDGQNNQTKESSKCIRLEKIDGTETKVTDTVLSCHACGYKTLVQKELDKHILELHKNVMLDEEAAVENIKQPEKRKGRPPGVQNATR